LAESSEAYRRRASILSALANPARLHMADMLSGGPRTVGELSQSVGLDISTVSRHLEKLRKAGLVCDRREGTRMYHFLATPCVLDFFGCLERVLDGSVCQAPGCSREDPR
jgi:ArsR family transcriptional regulator